MIILITTSCSRIQLAGLTAP